MCGRGGTQVVGNKMILPAWGQGEGGRKGRVCILGTREECASPHWHCKQLATVVGGGDGLGWAGLPGWQVLWAAKKKKARTRRRPTPVESVPRLLLSCRKGGDGDR